MKPLRGFDLFGSGLLAAFTLGLAVLELARPLRARSTARIERWPANGVLGALAAAVERGLVMCALVTTSRYAARRKLGVLHRLPGLPAPLRSLAAFLLLDACMYGWHRANHRTGVLWRFHAVHHTDLDLDLSTAARLHPGELLLSIPARAAPILLGGASERTVLAYELTMQLASLSYHSDVDYGRLERAARVICMTPVLHTRHHAATRIERDCNWGVVLSIWDQMFGSYDPRPASDPRIGIEDERDSTRLGVRRLLALPRSAPARDDADD